MAGDQNAESKGIKIMSKYHNTILAAIQQDCILDPNTTSTLVLEYRSNSEKPKGSAVFATNEAATQLKADLLTLGVKTVESAPDSRSPMAPVWVTWQE
jgi:hypothetical protein